MVWNLHLICTLVVFLGSRRWYVAKISVAEMLVLRCEEHTLKWKVFLCVSVYVLIH